MAIALLCDAPRCGRPGDQWTIRAPGRRSATVILCEKHRHSADVLAEWAVKAADARLEESKRRRLTVDENYYRQRTVKPRPLKAVSAPAKRAAK